MTFQKGLTEDERSQILNDICWKVNTDGEMYRDNDSLTNDMFIEPHLYSVSPDIGKHFEGHGITKVSLSYQFDSLINFLDNGIDKNKKFCTAPYCAGNAHKAGSGAGLGTGSGECYKDGPFVLLGGYDENMTEKGIKYVVLNKPFYKQRDKLQAAYPDVIFVNMKDLNEILTKETNDKNPNSAIKTQECVEPPVQTTSQLSDNPYEKIIKYNNVSFDNKTNHLVFEPKTPELKMKAYGALKSAGLELNLNYKDEKGNRFFGADVLNPNNAKAKIELAKINNATQTKNPYKEVLKYNNISYDNEKKVTLFIPKEGVEEEKALKAVADTGLHYELGEAQYKNKPNQTISSAKNNEMNNHILSNIVAEYKRMNNSVQRN